MDRIYTYCAYKSRNLFVNAAKPCYVSGAMWHHEERAMIEAILERQAAALDALADLTEKVDRIMTDIDTFNTNFSAFKADFTTFSTDISAAVVRVQATLASAGNSPAIQQAAADVATIDTAVKQMDATIQGLDAPTPPPPAAT